MTIEQIRQHYNARPFQPFSLRLADGRKVPVSQPELMAIFPSARTIFVAGRNESHDIIDLLLVKSVHVGNGRLTRKRR